MKDNQEIAKDYTDCPVRKQRAQEANEAYVKGFLMGQEDPIEDIATTFKALIAFMFVVAGLTMVAFAIWGK
jgi:hypothetical protein